MRLVLLFSVSLLSVLSAQAGEPIFKVTGIYATSVEPLGIIKDTLKKLDLEPIPDPQSEKVPARPKAHPKVDLSRYQPWFVNGHNTSDSHLIHDHGVNPAELAGLNQDQKNRLHGKMHGEQPSGVSRSVASVRSVIGSAATSSCPNGQCPWANGPAQGGYRVRRRR